MATRKSSSRTGRRGARQQAHRAGATRDERDEQIQYSLRRIADRFRRAREEAGLTLREVAERAGLAPSTIQKIESHKIVPSIAVAVRLAHALNRRASYFLEDDQQAATDIRFIPRGKGRFLGKKGHPVAFQQIAEPLVNPRMEGYLLTVQPGGHSGDVEPIIYQGEEIVICTKGRLRFELRGQEYLLSPGDTLHFKGDIPHRWENPGSVPAEMIMIVAFTYG